MRRLIFSLAALSLFGGSAFADPGELGLSFKTTVAGKDTPSLSISPSRAVKSLQVTLKDEKGKSQVLRSNAVAARGQKVLPFKQNPGQSTYNATIEVTWADGGLEQFQLEFEATRLGELKLSIPKDTVDLDSGSLVAQATNPVSEVVLTITGESGKVLHVETERFEPALAPQQDIALRWPSLSEAIAHLEVKVTDVGGFWSGLRLTPFSIEIPHEEVVFDSGKATLRQDQTPALETTWGHVQAALAKHGTLLDLSLYVAGYTDTVGDKAANRALSAARAQSIAAWFKQRGLKIAVYYAGFGEDALAVQTPDETESQANRRALYLLSVHSPTGPSFPNPQWKRL